MAYFCPRCDEKTTVVSTTNEVRRRRCLTCDHRFYTEEIDYEPHGRKNPFTVQRLENRIKEEERANATN